MCVVQRIYFKQTSIAQVPWRQTRKTAFGETIKFPATMTFSNVGFLLKVSCREWFDSIIFLNARFLTPSLQLQMMHMTYSLKYFYSVLLSDIIQNFFFNSLSVFFGKKYQM